MNIKGLILGLVVAAPLHGAGEYLLKGTTMTNDGQRWVASDGASLISKNGGPQISADRIVFEQSSAVFKFTGHVVIQAAGSVIETSEATLKADGQRVFFLSNGAITLSGGQSADPKTQGRGTPAFAEPFPKTETKLTPRR